MLQHNVKRGQGLIGGSLRTRTRICQDHRLLFAQLSWSMKAYSFGIETAWRQTVSTTQFQGPLRVR
jgi:hypothetical protein